MYGKLIYMESTLFSRELLTEYELELCRWHNWFLKDRTALPSSAMFLCLRRGNEALLCVDGKWAASIRIYF